MDTGSRSKWALKTLVALAIVLALMGVGSHYLSRTMETTVPVTVRWTNVPEGYVVSTAAPKVEARIKGPAGLVAGWADNALTHEMDLQGVSGRRFVELSPTDFQLPRGAHILEIHPSSWAIQVDARAEKSVPIVADLVNTPPAGYVVSAQTVTPSSLRLSGPATALEKISAVQTTPLDLSGMTESTKKKLALVLPDRIDAGPEENRLVEIKIDIAEKIVQQSIAVPVQGTGCAFRFSIEPPQIALLVEGPENTVKKLAQGDGIGVRVHLGGTGPGTYLLQAVIEPPLNTTIIQAEPTVFSVRVFE